MKTNIKIIATSLALTSSLSAWAGIGGLSVQSHLGQPFSGSIVVTGDEAQALKASRSVTVSGSGIRGSVTAQGNGNVVVRLRSSSPIREPIITFTVTAGRQTREYTALLNPANYTPQPAPQRVEKSTKTSPTQSARSSNNVSGNRDFINRNDSDLKNNTLPNDENNRATRKSNNKQTRNNANRLTNHTTMNQANPVVRQSGKIAVSPRRHRAQSGETLSSIANRYRPRNMSVQTASRALAMANPSVFKRGNTVQRPTTLYIPTPAQWYAYAQRDQYRPPAARPARPAVSTTTNTVTHTQPINQTSANVEPNNTPSTPAAPVAQPKPTPTPKSVPPTDKPATPATTAAPESQPQANTPPATPNPSTSAPTKTPSTASPVHTPQAASTAASAVAKAVKPTKAMTAAAASATSAVVVQAASDVMFASQPKKLPPMQPAETMPATDSSADEEDSTDWMSWMEEDWIQTAAIGLGATGLLGGLAYYLIRRRRTHKNDEYDGEYDDGILIDESEITRPSIDVDTSTKVSLTKGKAAASLAPATAVDDGHDFLLNREDDLSANDFETLPDDDNDVTFETAPLSQTAADQAFNSNDFEPDASSLKSNPDADAADDDWAWANSNTAQTLDELDQLGGGDKVESDDQDWTLDDDHVATDYAADEDDPFSVFADEDEGDVPASNRAKSTSATDELDDIDAMFADKLAGFDDELSAENERHVGRKEKSAAAELDDIDAMFADKLAGFDDELSAENERHVGRKEKSAAAELDDIDAMFADKLAGFDDELAAFENQTAPTAASTDNDDIDAMFSDALFGLEEEATHQQTSQLDHDFMSDTELESLNSLSAFDQMADFESVNQPKASQLDDIDGLLMDSFGDLESDRTTIQPKPIMSDEEMESLNSLSDLDNLNAADEMDSMFADALADLDTLDDKPHELPATLNHEQVHSDDSDDLSALDIDALAFDTPSFVDEAVEESAFDAADSMAFDVSGFEETPITQPESESFNETDDADALAFDLSHFDTTIGEENDETEFPDFSANDGLEFDDVLPEASLDTLDTTPADDFSGFDGDLSDSNLGEFTDFDAAISDSGDNQVDFVSGAVGMGEPLEAKLELAKMFIEIEDADSARALLNELVQENDSKIAEQAKALLAKING